MNHLMLQSREQPQPAPLPTRLPLAPQPQQPQQPIQQTSSPPSQATAPQLQGSTPLLAVSVLLDSIATIGTIRNCLPQAPAPTNLQQVSSGGRIESRSAEYLPDRRARKKDQNRRAALNYRRKKMEEKNRIREEEMRLVYSRVCQIGYAEQLDKLILYILETKTTRVPNKEGGSASFLCPLCPVSCDSTLNLRSHLNMVHYSSYRDINSSC